jgi:hypothetical protein
MHIQKKSAIKTAKPKKTATPCAHTALPWLLRGFDATEFYAPNAAGVTIGRFSTPTTVGIDGNYSISLQEARANAKYAMRAIELHDELLKSVKALRSAFMSHTQWNGPPPAEIIAADALIAKAYR